MKFNNERIEVNRDKLDIVLRFPINHCMSLFRTINGEYCKEDCIHCPFLTKTTLIRWLKEDE